MSQKLIGAGFRRTSSRFIGEVVVRICKHVGILRPRFNNGSWGAITIRRTSDKVTHLTWKTHDRLRRLYRCQRTHSRRMKTSHFILIKRKHIYTCNIPQNISTCYYINVCVCVCRKNVLTRISIDSHEGRNGARTRGNFVEGNRPNHPLNPPPSCRN